MGGGAVVRGRIRVSGLGLWLRVWGSWVNFRVEGAWRVGSMGVWGSRHLAVRGSLRASLLEPLQKTLKSSKRPPKP